MLLQLAKAQLNLKGKQLKIVDTSSYLGGVVTRNRKIQVEINERPKKALILSSCKAIIKKIGHQ
jgi:hypothetical protein